MPPISRRKARFMLFGLLCLAAALRFWGIGYGLPHPTARPDEERIVGRAFHILASGDFHLVTFTYPGLIIYLQSLGLWLYAHFGLWVGWYQEMSDFLLDVAIYRPGLEYRICRSVSALLATATVWLSYRVSREMGRSRRAALIAAALVATAYLHVRDSHFATVDVGMTFFVTLSLFFASRAYHRQRNLDFLLAGFAAGLAIAAKYNAGVVLGAALVAAFAPMFGPAQPLKLPEIRPLARKLLLIGAASIAGFALATPYNWLYPKSTIDAFTMIRTVLYDAESPRALWTHLGQTFPIGYGWAFYLFGFVGVIRSLFRRGREWVLLGFLIPTLWTVLSVRWTLPRYLIPVLAPLAVFAAGTADALIVRALTRVPRPLAAVVITAILASLIGPGLFRSIAFDRVAKRKDTRVLAAEWANERLPPRSSVALCRGYGAPQLNTDRRRARPFDPQLIGCDAAAADTEFPYLITHEHPQLLRHSQPPEELLARLREEAEELVVFRPFRMPYRRELVDKRSLYFDHDAFYLPFAGLDTVERGGPTIRIWKLARPRPEKP